MIAYNQKKIEVLNKWKEEIIAGKIPSEWNKKR
jgi:hypothetical protein